MLSIRIYLFITLLFFSIFAQSQPSHLQSYNVVWTTPSRNSSESMPCGGGDIGLNVWVENGDLLIYFSRSGSFDENNALLKGGRIRIRLNPNPFQSGSNSTPPHPFRQELLLQDGYIKITGTNTQIKIWVDVFHPIIHIDCSGSKPFHTTATYESWRTADREMTGRANNANSYKWAPKHAPGGKVFTYRDSIRFQDDRVLFYHRNRPGPNVFDVTVHQQGLDSVKSLLPNPLKDLTFGGQLSGENLRPSGTIQGRYLDTDFTGWQLTSKQARRTQNIRLVLATAPTPTVQAWEDTLANTARQSSSPTATQTWWHAFWNRSFIYIEPNTPTSPQWQAARNYQLFRYMLACNATGRYPTKFNGGLFTYDPSFTDTSLHYTPDFRNWGGGTMTAQNQRLVYFPMTRSGDFDLQKNQLDYYTNLLPAAEARTRIYWNHAGASFTEQLENFGLPNSAEYGWDMPTTHDIPPTRDTPPTHDKGVEYNAWLEYEWDTVLEFCLMMLDRERYTGADIHEYLPFIQSCLTFFDEHYQYLAALRGRRSLDGEGHLILYPGSGGETYKMAYNSSSTIAGLHTILTRLLELPATYLDDSARHTCTAMLNRLPPLSFRSFDGHPTIAPARSWERINNKEPTQLYPVYPWGLYGIGKPGLDTAINTFKYDTDAIKFRSYIGWKQDNIFAARLGLTDEAATLTIQKLQDAPRRFPAFWGPGFDWTPDHNWGGSGMIGLQEMLLQTDDKKIYLFPAWPRDWDVHFKLYAPYSTTIECTLKHGNIESLIVIPESRKKDIIKTF
ncbi:MAG TPA: DUF5703 domain-containing protein [Puia sp.]